MTPHDILGLPYREPLGLPLRWQDDITGRLPEAMQAYLANRMSQHSLSQEDFALVRAYLEYLVNAPCWNECEGGRPLTRARRAIRRVQTPEELGVWIHRLLNLGIDPI